MYGIWIRRDRAEVSTVVPIIHCGTKFEGMPSHLRGSLNGYINSAKLLRLINRRTCPPSWRWAIVTRASFRPAASRLVRRARWIDWIFYRVLPRVHSPALYPREGQLETPDTNPRRLRIGRKGILRLITTIDNARIDTRLHVRVSQPRRRKQFVIVGGGVTFEV